MPQPWPQVSPDHTNDVAAGWIAAVENVTRSAMPAVPSAEVNEMSASYCRPGASPSSISRAVWSVRSSAQGPRTVRSRRPLLDSRTDIRPSPEARPQSTAESVVTSPDRAPEVSSTRCRSSAGEARPTP